MHKRTFIKDLSAKKGEEVSISGWVDVRRDQGKMIFLDIRDMTGKVQSVVLPNHTEALEVAKQLRSEWVVKIVGKVNARPEKNVNTEVTNGDIELEVTSVEVLAKAEPLPFDMSIDGYNLDLVTELDNRALVLRHPKVQAVFKVQETIIDAFREHLKRCCSFWTF